ncbi:hypothetical protein [Vibrio diazotrophicus]|uniref:hypothetical protein n=1 Tax=Vibrio diazotrophicus TaxID=685 RepID=UPI00142D782A|nr:hypothetical protein [Vibrio diazotrophicus]NIY91118.1 hypothetical protein [Vibrio diazotrophicus]
MSELAYSVENYKSFIDYIENNQLVKESTLVNWKSAPLNVLSVLSPEEGKDLTQFTVDELVETFKTRNGKDLSEGTVTTYRSRLNKGLTEFFNYVRLGDDYEPHAKTSDIQSSKNEKPSAAPTNKPEQVKVKKETVETYTLPFPLRAGVMVKITDLPTNLTAEEAERIAAFVKACVNEK